MSPSNNGSANGSSNGNGAQPNGSANGSSNGNGAQPNGSSNGNGAQPNGSSNGNGSKVPIGTIKGNSVRTKNGWRELTPTRNQYYPNINKRQVPKNISNL